MQDNAGDRLGSNTDTDLARLTDFADLSSSSAMSPSLHDHDHVLPLQCTQFPRDVCIETLCFSCAHAADHAVYNSIMGCAHTSVRVITLAGLKRGKGEKL